MAFIGEINSSVAMLQKSLSIYDKLAATSTDDMRGSGDTRAKLGIMSSLAKALCMQEKFEEGMQVFRDCIKQESEHVGEFHHNLGQKYVNAGVCAIQGGLYLEARDFLRKVLKVSANNPHVSMVESVGIARRHLTTLDSYFSESSRTDNEL
jgi:tetratricopeptide (TPR) repeat protein